MAPLMCSLLKRGLRMEGVYRGGHCTRLAALL